MAPIDGPRVTEQSRAPDDELGQALAAWQSARDAYGPHDESTLTALLAVAGARQRLGALRDAVQDAAAVRDGRRALLGEEHRDTVAAAWLTAGWRMHLGEEGAADEVRELVPAMTRFFGEEEPDTVRARHMIALAEEPHTPAAERLLRWVQLCGVETRVFGVRHELTQTAAFGVAQARQGLGDLFGAYSDALVVEGYRVRLLGEHHPDTLTVKLSRVRWNAESSGVTTKTLADLDELIPNVQTVLGHDHLSTLIARFLRIFWTKAADNEVDRISEWELLADDLLRTLGSEDPFAVEVQQRRTAAREEWQQSLQATRDVAFDLFVDMESEDLGIDTDPERLWMDTGNLDEDAAEAVGHDADEQQSEQSGFMEEVLAAKRSLAESARTLGNDAYETLRWRYYLAWTFWSDHEFGSAGHWARRLVDDAARLLGDDNPLTQASRALMTPIEAKSWSGPPPFWHPSWADH